MRKGDISGQGGLRVEVRTGEGVDPHWQSRISAGRVKLGLTFKKALFSSAFMITGGMARRKKREHESTPTQRSNSLPKLSSNFYIVNVYAC